MSKSDSVKIAEIQGRNDTLRQVVSLLSHPVFSLTAAFFLVEYLESRQLIGKVASATVESALVTKELLGSLAQSGLLEAVMAKLASK